MRVAVVRMLGVSMDGMSWRALFVARRRRLSRKAGARAKQRDQAGKNGPDERKKDDGLKH